MHTHKKQTLSSTEVRVILVFVFLVSSSCPLLFFFAPSKETEMTLNDDVIDLCRSLSSSKLVFCLAFFFIFFFDKHKLSSCVFFFLSFFVFIFVCVFFVVSFAEDKEDGRLEGGCKDRGGEPDAQDPHRQALHQHLRW